MLLDHQQGSIFQLRAMPRPIFERAIWFRPVSCMQGNIVLLICQQIVDEKKPTTLLIGYHNHSEHTMVQMEPDTFPPFPKNMLPCVKTPEGALLVRISDEDAKFLNQLRETIGESLTQENKLGEFQGWVVGAIQEEVERSVLDHTDSADPDRSSKKSKSSAS